jgi:type IX secretion system PorP/SprF family membrane protein|tara:strand:+ start:1798 stop:2811 length:1014 start_codon:yes stop_codon:yes gene_type:complete
MLILIAIKNNFIKLNLFLFLCFIINSTSVFAQDPIFTQFYSNPVYLNPAFSGTHHCPRIVSNYRNQWPNFSGDFITTSISYDQYVDALKGGFGVILMSDQIAKTLNSNEASLSYSYHQHITRKFTVNFALQGTYIQKSVNQSNLTFGDMIHPRRGFVFSTADVIKAAPVNLFDFSAGILGYSDRFYIGFATHHLTEPKISLVEAISPGSSPQSYLNRRYTAHMGTEITLGSKSVYSEENETLSPSVLFVKQGDYQQLNVGLYYKKGNYVVGAWYRDLDSFIITLGLDTKILRMGYSYDLTTSQLGTYSGGSHEISLALKLYCAPKKKKFRTMSCPAF